MLTRKYEELFRSINYLFHNYSFVYRIYKINRHYQISLRLGMTTSVKRLL